MGDPDGAVDARMLVGHCMFASPDAALLVPLLPQWVHVRGERRLSALVQLVGDESRSDRPAREIVMARLLEVMLIEALRSTASTSAARTSSPRSSVCASPSISRVRIPSSTR